MRNIAPFTCAALAIVVATTACRPGGEDGAERTSTNAVSPIDRLPVAEHPMDRAALLMAAARAASAAALGGVDTVQRRLLDGKRFEVRIRFGCPGDPLPQGGSAPFEIKFDEVDRMLRVRAAPDLNREEPLVSSIAGEAVEAVEGFWLRRPWLLADGCPRLPAPDPTTEAQRGPNDSSARSAKDPDVPPPSPTPALTVGIAEFFTEADSRAGRRDGRAYQAAKVLGGVERPSNIGYNLVLSGRLRQLPSGQVITCVAANPDQPPQCLISADFDRVRIEAPGTREILAEWNR